MRHGKRDGKKKLAIIHDPDSVLHMGNNCIGRPFVTEASSRVHDAGDEKDVDGEEGDRG